MLVMALLMMRIWLQRLVSYAREKLRSYYHLNVLLLHGVRLCMLPGRRIVREPYKSSFPFPRVTKSTQIMAVRIRQRT